MAKYRVLVTRHESEEWIVEAINSKSPNDKISFEDLTKQCLHDKLQPLSKLISVISNSGNIFKIIYLLTSAN